MLISNCWKHTRNLANVIRHNQYRFDNVKSTSINVKLTPNNVLTTLKEHTGRWNLYSTYKQQQINLTQGIISSITKLDPTLNDKSNSDGKTIQGRLYNKTVDILCTVNDDIEFTHGATIADIGKLAVKYKLISYEWYLHLAQNGQPFGYGSFNYNKNNLPKSIQDAKAVLERRDYFIDYDPNGIGMKQSFRGFYDNPYLNKDGTLDYHAELNIDKYDSRNSVPILFKFGEYVTVKILNCDKEKDDSESKVVVTLPITNMITSALVA
jgi:hypothetical protein